MDRGGWICAWLALAVVALAGGAQAKGPGPGLLFYYSGDKGFAADVASGSGEPLFKDKVAIIKDGKEGPALQDANDGVIAWSAPGNIYAEQGTLSLFWRAREPLGRNQFPVFRVGYSDHTSWDMVFLRIDWNGHGFDAFVTDDNLARVRVSYQIPEIPKPDKWLHIAFSWDERTGVRLYVNGKLVAQKNQVAVLDDGLFGFGPHARIISPMQVQTRYSFMRGGDIDEIAIFDRQLDDKAVNELKGGDIPETAALARSLADEATRQAWAQRFGWLKGAPPYLASASTSIRKVEFTDARDIKELMWKGSDGIRETTWPGVYNRSRLAGRDDYFELPDWNVYSGGGKSLTLTLPNEPFNRVEIQGAAYGTLNFVGAKGEQRLTERPQGLERTTTEFPTIRGGKLRFDNAVQETPIQEIAAYNVQAGTEPAEAFTLRYTVKPNAAPDYPALAPLLDFIKGRYLPDERAIAVALPAGAPSKPTAPGGASLPIVHVLIPADFRLQAPGQPLPGAQYAYGWEKLNAGLDGIAIDLPALKVKAVQGGLVPLNIRVMDPLRADRALMDIDVSVKPREPRQLWLDTRDRLLPNGKSLYLTIAAAGADFNAASLDGMKIRLVFKDRAAAIPEHVADRFMAVRDNTAFFIEEHTNTKSLPSFQHFVDDITDLFRAEPNNQLARYYWAEFNPEQSWPAFDPPKPPKGVPLWAFRQVADLKLYQQFVDWWIDHRQIDNGEFGGGLSDDTDLTNLWPGLSLMGVEPEKINGSLAKMVEGIYANGMFTNGLGTIKTDELHSYEEGINGISQSMYVRYGDPEAVERLMATARNYDRLTAVNSAGHRHIVSNYFSGSDIVREGVWEWQKPPSNLVLHPGILLVDYNGNPATKKIILELADGYLAHGKQQPDGTYVYPFDINWRTDQDRGRGVERALQIFWAAYRWTGDEKYLRPLYGEVRDHGAGAIEILNGDVVTSLAKPEWAKALTKDAAGGGSDFARYEAWRSTGDKRFLEELYGDQVQRGTQRMYILTDGEWWSDRVEYPSEELQRSRLGGVALVRNQITPGHLVSWRFRAPARASDVALLVTQPSKDRLKIVAFNLDDSAVTAAMTPRNLPSGTWRLTSGIDANGDDVADAPGKGREVTLERSRGLDLTFTPRRTTVVELVLVSEDAAVSARPDLGIGQKDVRLGPGAITVRVHSLGARATGEGTLSVIDAKGHVLAKAAIPPLAAPLDLQPKTADVRIGLPKGAPASRLSVRVALNGGAKEITELNNLVSLNPPLRSGGGVAAGDGGGHF